MGINPLGVVGGLVGGVLGGGGDGGGGPGGLLGGVLGGGGGGAGGLLGGLLGGGDPLSGLIGAAGDMLGLPKELTGALKVGAGLFTGDVMSVVSGGVELAGSLAHDLSSQTRSSFDRPESAVKGYAHSMHLRPPVRHHGARPVVSRPPPRHRGTDVHITIDCHSHGGVLDRNVDPGVVRHGHSRPPPHGRPVPGQAPHHAPRTDGTSSTEATGSSGGAKEQYEMLKTLEENFDQIDMRYLGPLFGHDGHIDMDDLKHLSDSTNCPPDVKRAVRYLMEDPALYQKLARSGGAITRADIQMAMDDAQSKISSTGGASSGGEVSHTGDADETGGTHETSGSGSASGADEASEGGDPSGGIGDQITGILNNPNLSIEEKIEQVLMLLENQVDGEIQDTMDEMAANQSKSKKGKDASQADGEKSANTQQQLQMKLQQLIERRKALFDLMSNIDSKFNEMSSVAIQNLGKA